MVLVKPCLVITVYVHVCTVPGRLARLTRLRVAVRAGDAPRSVQVVRDDASRKVVVWPEFTFAQYALLTVSQLRCNGCKRTEVALCVEL